MSARREFHSAITSLGWAEDLRDLLAANYDAQKINGYFLDALDRANALVNEMSANLDDVMSRYSPEECGA